MALAGIKKIWVTGDNNEDLFNYQTFMDSQGVDDHANGLKIDVGNLMMQVLNCFIISIIMLQSEIFDSAGYQKFVTQDDGSMDLMIQLGVMKAKSITYVFNNKKIRKILSIQRKRESIMGTVDKIKEKIIRWRQFTRTTLVNAQIAEAIPITVKVEALDKEANEALELEKKKSTNKKVEFEEE